MLNNQGKINENRTPVQMVAGIMQNDSNVEFVGVKTTKEVVWMQNGCTHYFKDLPGHYFQLIKEKYLQDKNAQAFLKEITPELKRQVELYTYYVYGDLDHVPDIKDGALTEPENFRDTENCPSLLWNKEITIKGIVLTAREILITDLFAKDLPDKFIADYIGISHSYLDTVKRNLFSKVGVVTKSSYLLLALAEKVVLNYGQ